MMRVARGAAPGPPAAAAVHGDVGEGYLSDVPSMGSHNGSEVSHDLIGQTKVLEKHFRDKYQALRGAYEQRIRDLSQVIQSTCVGLLSDEVIAEMKTDKASSFFIPAHVFEVIDKQLECERERYLHDTLQQKSGLETELAQYKHGYNKLRAEYRDAQRSWQEQDEEQRHQLQTLSKSLQDKSSECDKLKKLVEHKTYEVDVLEQSFQQSARELAIIENIDHQSQRHQKDIQDQLMAITKQRNQLHEDGLSAKAQLSMLAQERDRLLAALDQFRREENVTKRRVQEMMKEVDAVLQLEASETNAAISTVNEKMKSFRQRLVSELNKERRLTASLQDELTKLRSVKESTFADHKRYLDDEAAWKERVFAEQQKVGHFQALHASLSTTNQELKTTIHGLEHKNRMLIEKLEELEVYHKRERALVMDKARAEALREADALRTRDQRASDSQMHNFQHLESEVQSLTQTVLRQSLSLQTAAPPANNSSLDTQQWKAMGRLEGELEHHKALLSLQTDKDRLAKDYRRCEEDLQTLRSQHAELGQVVAAMNAKGLETVAESGKYKELLKTATANIDKLRSIVTADKEALTQLRSDLVAESQQRQYHEAQLAKSVEHLREVREQLQQVQDRLIQSQDRANQSLDRLREAEDRLLRAERDAECAGEERDKAMDQLAVLRQQYDEQTRALETLHLDCEDNRRGLAELQSANAVLVAALVARHPATASVSVAAQSFASGLSTTSLVEEGSEAGADDLAELSRRPALASVSVAAIVDTRDAGVNTSDNPQLVEVSDQLSRVQLDKSMLQGRMDHVELQFSALTSDLQNARSQARDLVAQNQRLQTALHSVRTCYLPQLQALRQALAGIRSQFESFHLQLQSESILTTQRFGVEFARIFDGYATAQRRRAQSLKAQLGAAHSQELTVLELKFIEQINLLNHKHSAELDAMHRELLSRAEKAVNASLEVSRSEADGAAVAAAAGTEVALVVGPAGSGAGGLAFESVLRGVLQGLQDQEAVSATCVAQVSALAKGHKEPSLAACTAARAIVSEEMDAMVLRLIKPPAV